MSVKSSFFEKGASGFTMVAINVKPIIITVLIKKDVNSNEVLCNFRSD